MLRTLVLSSLTLLALDGVSTVLAPATGVSLTGEAAAADFTGRIKRVRIKKRRTGSGYKITANTTDDGDATAADAATYELTICAGTLEECSETVELTQDSYTGVVRTGRFAFDGAVAPEGEFELLTNLRDADGELVGASQSWTLTAKGGELTLTSSDEIKEGAYIAELTLHSDECGNGRGKALVTGDDAETVATVEWVDLDGIVFSSEDVSKCDDGTCVTGELKKGKTTSSNTDADFGGIQVDLGELADVDIEMSISAFDGNGDLIGTTSTEAVSKYGDILIDGVPLEFDLASDSSDPFLLATSFVDDPKTGVATVTTWAYSDVGDATVDISLTDAETGKEFLLDVATTTDTTRRVYEGETVDFDPGEDVAGYPYLVLVDMLDSNGDPVGEQFEAEIVMPSYDAETDTTAYDRASFTDGSGGVGFLADENGLSSFAWFDGDTEVAGMNIIFEEPYEGPAPLETEVYLSAGLPLYGWTHVAVSHTPALVGGTVTLNDTEGNELESAELKAEGPGDGEAAFIVFHNRRDGQEEKYMNID